MMFPEETRVCDTVGEPGWTGCSVEEQKARMDETTRRLDGDAQSIRVAESQADAKGLDVKTRIDRQQVAIQHARLREQWASYVIKVIKADSRWECKNVYTNAEKTEASSYDLAKEAARLAGSRPPPQPVDKDKGGGSGGGGGPLVSVSGGGIGTGAILAILAVGALLYASRR